MEYYMLYFFKNNSENEVKNPERNLKCILKRLPELLTNNIPHNQTLIN